MSIKFKKMMQFIVYDINELIFGQTIYWVSLLAIIADNAPSFDFVVLEIAALLRMLCWNGWKIVKSLR